MRFKKIFVCGGDERSVYIAEYFENAGCKVTLFGHGNEDNIDDISTAELVVLGLPAVKDGIVNMPFSKKILSFENLISRCGKDVLVAGGRFTHREEAVAKTLGIKLFDYSEDEDFQLENALYTAEGAIASLIGHTTVSVCNRKILVAGYGRIAKSLCTLMSSWPCHLCVYARSLTARTMCKVCGIDTMSILQNISGFDVVINTIPADVFSKEVLLTAKKDALILDLSASPGYIDKDFCRMNNIDLLYLPGIPRTSAPQSAGYAAAGAVERYTEGN